MKAITSSQGLRVLGALVLVAVVVLLLSIQLNQFRTTRSPRSPPT